MSGPANHNSNVGRGLRAVGGWVVLAAVALSPWPGGGLRPWGIQAVQQLIAAGVLLWAAGCAIGPARPRIPLPCLLAVVALLLLGWATATHPRAAYDWRGHRLVPLPGGGTLSGMGTIDATTSIEWMTRVSALLALLVVLCDLARQSAWRVRVLAVIGINGTAIVLWGIVQRVAAAWADGRGAGTPFGFSTFEYHGNAGAFINLAIPALAGLLLSLPRGSKDERGHRRAWRRALIGALLVCAVGALVNPSRAALALTVAEALALTAYAWSPRPAKARARVRWRHAAIAALGCIGLAVAAGGVAAWRRWSSVWEALGAHGPRVTLWRICGNNLIRDAGAFGYGPGTFKVLMPMAPGIASLYSLWIVTWHVPGGPVSLWSNAHQDYLQTIIEWGWAGTAAWALLLFGGFVQGVRSLLGRRALLTPADRAVLYGALVALAATFLHAAVDFPLQILSIQTGVAACVAICWAVPSDEPTARVG